MAVESLLHKRARALQIIAKLDEEFPELQTALVHHNPFELLIATILSAQCTDVRVNKVTPALFQIAPDAPTLAKLSIKKIEKLIGSVNFFRSKAKNIKACAAMLIKDFDRKIPEDLEHLIKLPGVGRKTANVVLGNAFGQPSVVVDTHVKRLANRLRLSNANAPEEIEADLERVVDRERWIDLSHLLIYHGRKTCKALRPRCAECLINRLCPSRIKEER